MKNGPARFEFYLQKITLLMQQASKEINPALWLYSNDARTPLFMLEALTKLYASLHNKKKFTKLNVHFKLLEDAIGAIDYYDNYAKLFLEHPTVPVHIREYIEAQMREKVQHLNDLLLSNKWLGNQPIRLKKIRKNLKNTGWLEPKKEADAVKEFYGNEIKKIKKFVKKANGNFTEMEAQVHELRRDLRWLSIYPQALQGMIQLTNSGMDEKSTEKYLTPEIVHSKYNVMPDAGDNKWFVLFDKNYFYALSWMIAETGKLKDKGLQFFAATEALEQTEKLSHKDAYNKSFEILGEQKDSIDQLLSYASEITQAFIKEKNMEKIIYGLARTQKAPLE